MMPRLSVKRAFVTVALCGLLSNLLLCHPPDYLLILVGLRSQEPRALQLRASREEWTTLRDTRAARRQSSSVYITPDHLHITPAQLNENGESTTSKSGLETPAWGSKTVNDGSETLTSVPETERSVLNTRTRHSKTIRESGLPFDSWKTAPAGSVTSNNGLKAGSAYTKTKKRLILIRKAAELFRGIRSGSVLGCETCECVLTNDVRLHKQADAVVYKICTLAHKDVPFPRTPGQTLVAYCMEPPPNFRGAYNSSAWSGVFNLTLTYRRDSDLYKPYNIIAKVGALKSKNYSATVARKTKTAAWFVSACTTPSRREDYVKQLQRHIDVDIYGRCGKDNCPKQSRETCLRGIETNYRFYIAFENSFCVDYLTEKVFSFYDLDLVPVVRGGANYETALPKGTYVNTADFGSPAALAAYLKYLASNDTAYEEILRKKDQYRPLSVSPNPLCKLCEWLQHGRNVKTYHNLPQWLEENTCWQPSDL